MESSLLLVLIKDGEMLCTSSLRATSGYCTLTRNRESTKHGPDSDQGTDPSPDTFVSNLEYRLSFA